MINLLEVNYKLMFEYVLSSNFYVNNKIQPIFKQYTLYFPTKPIIKSVMIPYIWII